MPKIVKDKIKLATESNKITKISQELKTKNLQKDEQRNDQKTPKVNLVLPPNQNSYAKIVSTSANKQEKAIVMPTTIKPKESAVKHNVSLY